MFTGIIKNKGKVVSIVKKDKGYEFKIRLGLNIFKFLYFIGFKKNDTCQNSPVKSTQS